MTCVTANNGFPRSIIFLSLHTQGTLTFITSLPRLSDAEDDRFEGVLEIRFIIGLDFAETLSSPDSFCVLFDITPQARKGSLIPTSALKTEGHSQAGFFSSQSLERRRVPSSRVLLAPKSEERRVPTPKKRKEKKRKEKKRKEKKRKEKKRKEKKRKEKKRKEKKRKEKKRKEKKRKEKKRKEKKRKEKKRKEKKRKEKKRKEKKGKRKEKKRTPR